MAVSSKLAQHLANFNKTHMHTAAIAELNAKADKAEAAGHHSNETKFRKRIFDAMEKVFGKGEVTWIEPHFVRGEMTIEKYSDYSGERPEDGNWPTKDKPSMHYGWRGGDFQFQGDLKGFSPILTFKEEYRETSSWRSTPNGKTRIYVGDYGSKVMFKQMKDGTHRYGDIAQEIHHQAQGYRHKQKALRQEASNKSAVQQVLDGVIDYQGYNGVSVQASANHDAPITVRLDATRTLTVKQAIELLAVLKEFNIG